MKGLMLLVFAALACLVSGVGLADDKVDAKLVVGKWEVTKSDPGTVPAGVVIEFLKDGKMKAAIKKGDAEMTIEGSYKLDGNKMTLIFKVDGAERTQEVTVTKFSAKEMTVKDTDNKVVEFKKK